VERNHHEPRRARQENQPTHRQVLGGRRLQAKGMVDPAATLKAEGVELPAGLSYVAHENTDKVVHLVIPAKPTELSDEDLGDVVAGHGVLLGDLYPNDPRGCGITPSACRMTAFF
jgi:hypothetical protein